ncbi:MAG: hypothetical protein Q6356_001140 [Candidatus Wukongarchaeota archaeon]|jgi:hypothetical protein|nr:hypothetical protein [Candidatus Wukongarchaeota archaeon]
MVNTTKCPIYNDACTNHLDCLFQRVGGCAIVVAARNSEENKNSINQIVMDLTDIRQHLTDINRKLSH